MKKDKNMMPMNTIHNIRNKILTFIIILWTILLLIIATFSIFHTPRKTCPTKEEVQHMIDSALIDIYD